jgi:hypothetical protein
VPDTDPLADVRRTLEADGFHLDAREDGDGLHVTVTADPGTCDDCLVPKDVLRQILRRALGIPVESIGVTYPHDSPGPKDTQGANGAPGLDGTPDRSNTAEEAAR